MKLSLGKKTALLLTALGLFFSVVAILGSWHTIDTMSQEQFKQKADELAATVARVMSADDVRTLRDHAMAIYDASKTKVTSQDWGSPEFYAYVSQFAGMESLPEFQRLLKQLRRLQEVNSVNCLYLVAVIPEDEVCIYLVDATLESEDICPPGCLDTLYDINMPVLDNPEKGMPAYTTNTEEYGWIVTSSAPIIDATGEVVGYASVDISMDDIHAQERGFVAILAVRLLVLTIFLSAIIIVLVNKLIVRPINQLSKAAANYGQTKGEGESVFASLDIHTGDEVESLYLSMVQMEQDIESYIESIVSTNTQLLTTRLEAERMNELANKDALTGVRNRLAYDQESLRITQDIQEGKTEFGIVMVDLNDLKMINDTYGHDCGNVSIIQLCSVICETFDHSPVFRVGGDEFVAIVRGRDYAAVVPLCIEFKDRTASLKANTSLEPWQRISAAIGYALFDPQVDQSVRDVFKRADLNMYEDKRQMKRGR